MSQTRAKTAAVTAGSRLPTLHVRTMKKQEEGPQVKRSSSSPCGAPKKRPPFVDVTNALEAPNKLPGKKESKKQSKKTRAVSVSEKNAVILTKSSSVSSEGTPADTGKAKEVRKEEATAPPAVPEVPAHLQKQQIPVEFDIDSENSDDCYMCPDYAKEIFDYLKQREEKFVLSDYMSKQPSLNAEMRAILIDWQVDVQESFELYHETLYLAVKMSDHYLSLTPVHSEQLQLVGSTSMLIASKFEERHPHSIDDFLYICDDAYTRDAMINMEASILQTLSFDINIPVSYRFLRRYAKCVNAGMDTLTLARYYSEMSLMEMEFVPVRSSLMASACLLMALVTKELGGWAPILQFHSGYQTLDLAPVVRKLHTILSAPPNEKLTAIRNKYSHRVFFKVALLPLPSVQVLNEALSQ